MQTSPMKWMMTMNLMILIMINISKIMYWKNNTIMTNKMNKNKNKW